MKNKLFNTVEGTKVKVISHIKEVLDKHPDCEIYIGTDSQSKKKWTYYCTVVSFRYGSRGVHYIYNVFRIPRIRDIWTRLWKEVEISTELAEWIRVQRNLDITIDLDFSPDEFNDSHKLVNASKGMVIGLGFKANIKPDACIASKAADHEVRRYIKNRNKVG